ncbi:endonuclease V isoform X1 [Micractinium conductrix]|uniref:Endonuclease V isoform X1 n=1 Tax=Micractinium conductrix TaxID=554055 RepID=A0A2P6VQD1_9CHLO|nr:endonuclease V isoform X1 [Micractinium conductrix]|eukprot:PSC76275.1 endonuclease V isoform X1 [Micractinium conductrix]
MAAARGEAHAVPLPRLAEQQEAWKRQQASLAPHVVLHDDADWLVSSSEGGDWQARLHMVGGLDISVFPSVDASGGSGNGGGVASLAVLAFPSLALRHLEQLHLPSLTAPYIPGFLGFREVPAYLELLHRAVQQGVHPQLLLVDGFGVLHPRRCGSASQLGVLAGLPTVGFAKSLLAVDGLPRERQPVNRPGRGAALLQAQSTGAYPPG